MLDNHHVASKYCSFKSEHMSFSAFSTHIMGNACDVSITDQDKNARTCENVSDNFATLTWLDRLGQMIPMISSWPALLTLPQDLNKHMGYMDKIYGFEILTDA